MKMTKAYRVQSVKSSFRAKGRRRQALLRDSDGYISSESPKLYLQTPNCVVLYQLLANAEWVSSLQIHIFPQEFHLYLQL